MYRKEVEYYEFYVYDLAGAVTVHCLNGTEVPSCRSVRNLRCPSFLAEWFLLRWRLLKVLLIGVVSVFVWYAVCITVTFLAIKAVLV